MVNVILSYSFSVFKGVFQIVNKTSKSIENFLIPTLFIVVLHKKCFFHTFVTSKQN